MTGCHGGRPIKRRVVKRCRSAWYILPHNVVQKIAGVVKTLRRIHGVRLHVLASIEGLFSGIMAGMMGTMVIEMLTISEGAALLLISLLLLMGTTMFCIRHVLQETFSTFIQKYDYVLLVATCMLMLLTFWTFPFSSMENQPSPQHEENHHVIE